MKSRERKPLNDYKVQVSYWLVFTTEMEIFAESEEHAFEIAKEHSKHIHESEWDTKLDWTDAALAD